MEQRVGSGVSSVTPLGGDVGDGGRSKASTAEKKEKELASRATCLVQQKQLSAGQQVSELPRFGCGECAHLGRRR